VWRIPFGAHSERPEYLRPGGGPLKPAPVGAQGLPGLQGGPAVSGPIRDGPERPTLRCLKCDTKRTVRRWVLDEACPAGGKPRRNRLYTTARGQWACRRDARLCWAFVRRPIVMLKRRNGGSGGTRNSRAEDNVTPIVAQAMPVDAFEKKGG